MGDAELFVNLDFFSGLPATKYMFRINSGDLVEAEALKHRSEQQFVFRFFTSGYDEAAFEGLFNFSKYFKRFRIRRKISFTESWGKCSSVITCDLRSNTRVEQIHRGPP